MQKLQNVSFRFIALSLLSSVVVLIFSYCCCLYYLNLIAYIFLSSLNILKMKKEKMSIFSNVNQTQLLLFKFRFVFDVFLCQKLCAIKYCIFELLYTTIHIKTSVSSRTKTRKLIHLDRKQICRKLIVTVCMLNDVKSLIYGIEERTY